MKNLWIISLLLFFQFQLAAQIEKGIKSFDVLATYQNGVDTRNHEGLVSTNFSYGLTKHFTAGLSGQTSYFKSSGSDWETNEVVNANLRFYFNPDNITAFFADVGLNYDITAKDFSTDVGIGLNWFLSPNIALESRLTATIVPEYQGFIFNNNFKYFFNHSESKVDDEKENLLYKGSWVIGINNNEGVFNLISNRLLFGVDEDLFATFLTTSVGHFLSDGIVLGSQINYTLISFRDFVSIHELGIAPYLRIYPFDTAPDFTAFLEVGGGFIFLDSSADQITTYPKGFGALGANFRLASDVALEVKGSYQHIWELEDDSEVSNGGIINVVVGLKFFLNKNNQ